MQDGASSAVALGGYGLLASKWEKRQNDAERLSSESEGTFERCTLSASFSFPRHREHGVSVKSVPCDAFNVCA